MRFPWFVPNLQLDSVPILDDATKSLELSKINWQKLGTEWGTALVNFGIRVLLAFLFFFIGHQIIKFVSKHIRAFLEHRKLEGVAASLMSSLVVALLYLILTIVLLAILGVKSVSFAAMLASIGLAVGMSLSGQLQNLAGGVIIVLTKPFRIGDYIDAQGVSGTVRSVTFFHTCIAPIDNKLIYIPNGALSSGVVTNYSESMRRRVEWTISVEYNTDYDKVREFILGLLSQDKRIDSTPEPLIVLNKLADSSVDILVRAWVSNDDFWNVYWDFNRTVYNEFNKAGIGFPFPQITVHTSKD